VVVADLSQDAGWRIAVSGCRYVLHVASPVPGSAPKHEDDIIVPARDGTLRVLRAARDAGVQRIVLTSSVVAVIDGQEQRAAPFDETSWTNVDAPGVIAYSKSKTLAERAAWDFIRREGGELEWSVINPAAVFGPILGPDFSASIDLIKKLLDGFPACPCLYLTTVDVRDVADIHLRAMINPSANGQRFLAGTGELVSLLDISKILRAHMPGAARQLASFRTGWCASSLSLCRN
jgi:dihydroflavonol-4-reductase